MLSDKDMAIVREVFREFEKNKEYKLLEPLSAKIKELTGIETHMNNLQFIQTILTDYNHELLSFDQIPISNSKKIPIRRNRFPKYVYLHNLIKI